MTIVEDGTEVDHSKMVAELVLLARVRAGLSVEAAAEAAEMSRTTWTDIESGNKKLARPETLGRVARAINLDEERVLRVAGYLTQPLDDAREVEALRSLVLQLQREIAHLAAQVRGE